MRAFIKSCRLRPRRYENGGDNEKSDIRARSNTGVATGGGLQRPDRRLGQFIRTTSRWGTRYPARTPTAFAAAKANFALTETQQDGLGPIFNERSCSACHSNGAIGGAGQQIERRYGTLTNGVFNGLAATGGSLRQLFGIGGFNPSPGVNCQSGTDNVNPRRARRSSRAA